MEKMKLYLKILTLFILTLMLSSCLSPSAAKFWTNFEEDYQGKHLNIQGPWGGIRVIHWINSDGVFNKKEIIDFAIKNGWKLKSDSTYKSYLTQTWTYDDKPIFPLYWKGFTPKFDFDYSGFEDFPRWISGDIEVLSFTTNFVSINLETQENILTNGFIILNEQQNKMTLYHMWGE
jgi:hypothetical protein